MREARLASACLAALWLLGACGPQDTRPRPGVGSNAGVGAAGAAGAADNEAGATAGGADMGGAGAGAGGVPNLCPLAGGAGAAAGAAPVGTDLGELAVESVAVWKDGAQGAYTIIHDDICDWP